MKKKKRIKNGRQTLGSFISKSLKFLLVQLRVMTATLLKEGQKHLQNYKDSKKDKKIANLTKATSQLQLVYKQLVDKINNLNDDLPFLEQRRPGNNIHNLKKLTQVQLKRLDVPRAPSGHRAKPLSLNTQKATRTTTTRGFRR